MQMNFIGQDFHPFNPQTSGKEGGFLAGKKLEKNPRGKAAGYPLYLS
ncbi:MAG: hypothetical protein HC913_19500 [Microscillaceae bacterium]|nr:hypothetical protein [Microscillaceae bacterium]